MTDQRLLTPPTAQRVAPPRPARQSRLRGIPSAGRLLSGVSVLPTLLCTAWLVAAFPLAAVGQFFAIPVVTAAVLAAVVILPLGLGASRRVAPVAPWWATVATLAVAAGFTAFAAATHSQPAILRRDPGSYAQIGWWLSQRHGLTLEIPAAAFGTSFTDLTFASPGFYVQGDTIVPQFMTGWPTMLAAAHWVAGWSGIFMLPAVVGGCAVLAVAGLAARLVGAAWAPLAALLTALAWPVLRVSQTTLSESLACLVLAGGMCLVLDLVKLNGSGVAAEPVRRRVRAAAFVTGLVFAGGGLVRLDMGVHLALLVPVVGWWWLRRRPGAWPFVAGACVGGALAVLDGAFVTLPYVRTNWSSVWLMLVGLVSVAAATAVAAGWLRSGRAAPLRGRFGEAGSRWLAPVAAAAVVVCTIGLLLRPLFYTDHSTRTPATVAYTAEMQGWLDLPVDGTRGYTEYSLWWVSWYLDWPLLIAALVGAAALTFRVLRGRDRMWAPFLLVYGVSVLLTLVRPGITPDHPWADRRLVVEVIPALVLLACWTAATATRWVRAQLAGRDRWWASGWAGAVATASAVVFAVPVYAATAPMADGRTELGQLSAVDTVCRSLRPDDSVVLLDPLWVPTIRGQCGLPVAQLLNASPAKIARVADSIRAAGRTPVVAATTWLALAALPTRPVRILSFHTRQDQHQLLRRPYATDPLVIDFWLVRPLS